MWLVAVMLCCGLGFSSALDNGLARTPPMGWNDWERFRCNINCEDDPDHCISEKLFMSIADAFVTEGYRDLGYEYVNMDDCWLAKERDAQGRLQADPDRFPHGIKWLADYMHAKGLKLGIYEDFGTRTCAGYPGSEYYLQMDAQTFADWEVDYLKFDGCYSVPSTYKAAYPAMSNWMNRTGRPMLYSCSWPAYEEPRTKPQYPLIAKYCNIWRNYADIQDSWDSLLNIITFFGNDTHGFQKIAAPGQFNDPDMLVIGNFGLSYEQERVQMALWSILAAPLLMSTDIRNVRPEAKALLQNKGAIAVNQDPLGIQGRRIAKMGNVQVWTRPISPKGSFAFAFLNTGTAGTPVKVSIAVKDLGFRSSSGYNITEVFTGEHLGMYKPLQKFATLVNPTGIFFGKAVLLQ